MSELATVEINYYKSRGYKWASDNAVYIELTNDKGYRVRVYRSNGTTESLPPLEGLMEYIAVKDLEEGMMVDLADDTYADPDGDNTLLANQYVEVAEIEEETPNCFGVTFTSFECIGFPPDHKIKVVAKSLEELETI